MRIRRKKSIKRTSWYAPRWCAPGHVPPLAPSLRHCRFAPCPVLLHLPLRCVPVYYHHTMSAAGAILLVTGFLPSINQFSGPAYPWGVAGAAAQVGASKHLDPLQQRIDALLGCQGETN